MHKAIIKKIGPLFLLLTFSITSPVTKSWSAYYITGITSALVMGKMSYDYYQKQFTKKCRSIYQEIYQDVHNYNHFYHNDAQISDWDLKEIILYNNQEPYPFMAYYSLLIQTFLILQKHLQTLNNQLKAIDDHKKINNQHRETLLQIETKIKNLRDFTTKTISLVISLKNRIKLFREYNDDCTNYAQTLIP